MGIICCQSPGAGDRSRTYDLRITNALLYQLSYCRFSSIAGGVDGAPLKLQNNQLKQVTNFSSLDASVSQWCITIKAREGTTFRAALKTDLSRLTFGKEVRVDWEKRDK